MRNLEFGGPDMSGGTQKKNRGQTGKANAEASPYRLNGGGIYPAYMRMIYRMAGMSDIERPRAQQRARGGEAWSKAQSRIRGT